MILPDVNVLVYAGHLDGHRHAEYREWLRRVLATRSGMALTMTTAAGFCRLVTQRRVFADSSSAEDAAAVVDAWSSAPSTTWLDQSPAVWDCLTTLMRSDSGITGKVVPDAVLAATAIAHRATLATADRGFRRFPGLTLLHPLD